MLNAYEWTEHDWRTQRAEVMTLLPGHVCSPTDTLRHPADLPDRWWSDLERSLATLREVPTPRVHADQAKVTQRIQARFGDTVDTKVSQWETVHGDLHWNNLLGPDFALLDWELWGRGPAGTDAPSTTATSLTWQTRCTTRPVASRLRVTPRCAARGCGCRASNG